MENFIIRINGQDHKVTDTKLVQIFVDKDGNRHEEQIIPLEVALKLLVKYNEHHFKTDDYLNQSPWNVNE